MMIATEVDVVLVLPTLLEIRERGGQSSSSTLDEHFDAIRKASDVLLAPDLVEARVAYKVTSAERPTEGFVLYTPYVKSSYKLVAFVGEPYRRLGLGRDLADEALVDVVQRKKLAPYVFRGTDKAYQFWRSIGVV